MKKYFLKLVIIFIVIADLSAQNSAAVHPAWVSIYRQEGANLIALYNSNAGGLNTPQYSSVDLNNDGLNDLYLFERRVAGLEGLSLTFLNTGTAGNPHYVYAPEYQARFPKFENWVLLRDYNCDGIQDIFAFSPNTIGPAEGIQVLRGSYDANNKIQFQRIVNDILYPFPPFPPNSIFVQAPDLPAIDDIDEDGDLDVLNFNSAGGWVEYFRNFSQEQGYGCDTLLFEFDDDCWGRFKEPNLTNELMLSPSVDSCVTAVNWNPRNNIHPGSTIMTIDMDNDNDKEILLGDIQFNNMVMGYNGYKPDTALITSQDITFPSNTLPIGIFSFPAAFNLDIDDDGDKDLVACSNSETNSEGRKTSWYYENTANDAFPVFAFHQKDFLESTMLDHGTASYPKFFDYNNDGKLDLVIGHYGYKYSGGQVRTSLWLLENTGTLTEPAFTLIDTNYVNLYQYSINNIGYNYFVPSFGDLDGDGDKDLVVGLANGELLYLPNSGGSGIATFPTITPFWENIQIGQNATPQIQDIDLDGLPDLLIGEKFGNINYFRNQGTASAPDFSYNLNGSGVAIPTIQVFGGIDMRRGQTYGWSTPLFMNTANGPSIIAGGFHGDLLRYDNIYNGTAINTAFNLADTIFGGIEVGYLSAPDAADINNDGALDYVVGNLRGGINFYSEGTLGSDPLLTVAIPQAQPRTFKIYPNPANDAFAVDFAERIDNETVTIDIYSITGQQVFSGQYTRDQLIYTGALSAGMYIVRISNDQGLLSAEKLIIR